MLIHGYILGSLRGNFAKLGPMLLSAIVASLGFLPSLGTFGGNFNSFPLVQTATKSDTAKRLLRPDEWKSVETVVSPKISNDGRWSLFTTVPVEGDSRTTIRANDSAIKFEVLYGAAAAFDDTSQFAAYLIAPPKAVADQMRKEKKPIRTKLGLRRLADGAERTLDAVQSLRWIKDKPILLAAHQRQEGKKDGAGELSVIEAMSGVTLTLGNVADAVPNPTGTFLALEIDGETGPSQVQLLDLRTLQLRPVWSGEETVAGLTWSKKSDTLAFMFGKEQENKLGASYNVEVVTNATSNAPKITQLLASASKVLPAGSRFAEYRGLEVSNDGSRVAFGIQAWADRKPPRPLDPEKDSDVEIWNTKDLRIVPQQKRQLGGKVAETSLAVWKVAESDFKLFSTSGEQRATTINDLKTVWLVDPTPYITAVTNGWSVSDSYAINVESGVKTKVLTARPFGPDISRTERYIGYFQDKRWKFYDAETGRTSDPLAKAPSTFEDAEDDHLVPEKPPAGGIDWLADDEKAVISDGYDLYEYRPETGAVAKLTAGRKDRIRYQYRDVFNREDGGLASDPYVFQTFDRDTKGTGVARLEPGKELKQVFQIDKAIGSLQQAPGTDRVQFTLQTFAESPNVYISNTAFTAAKSVSRTNPQLADVKWGRAEIVNYKSKWGLPLQGILIYPADYSPDRRYPMVTYIYERLSDELNRFVRPIEQSAYNEQVLSQTGYFVFKPDIAYRDQSQPGIDAKDCLEPAVAAVLAKKVGVDGDRLGLMGHSWGAYQTAFVTTVSRVFKAGVAGAPLTELTSMYNSIFWNSGRTDQELFETSQGRIAKPFWDMPEKYFENSAVWRAKERKGPLLIAFGDADGAVDWHQGIYLYNTLRRLGKEMVMLVYPGENHGLVKPGNMKDYAMRLRHFLDVNLKGAKAEPWLLTGVPYHVPGN
jgi:dipeptidyl aminopeptidase/acylaminoacyl peptidase